MSLRKLGCFSSLFLSSWPPCWVVAQEAGFETSLVPGQGGGRIGRALWDLLRSGFGVRVLLKGSLRGGEQQWFQGELGGAAVAPGLCSLLGDS